MYNIALIVNKKADWLMASQDLGGGAERMLGRREESEEMP